MSLLLAKTTSNFDWTTIAAIAAAVFAIFAPLLTALVNNRHLLKKRQFEIFYKEKLELYKKFAIEFGYCQNENFGNKNPDFLSTVYQIMLITNKNIVPEIEKLLGEYMRLTEKTTPQVNHINFLSQFLDCVQRLNKDLEDTKKYRIRITPRNIP